MGPAAKPKILVIDDEQALVEVIREALSEEGMEVISANNADEGLRLFFQHQPHLVVLDIMLPGSDGWEVCRRIRQVSNLPILMLTARTDGSDLVRGLNMGADDYVTKPFSLDILRARIQALLRRSLNSRSHPVVQRFQAGDICIDMLHREVTVQETRVPLTPKEFDLLAYLVRHAGRTVPHRELLQQVWGPEYGAETQYLSLYIWYLRNRIEENPRRPRRIVTWRGLGYRFVPAA
ncbi:MAG: response regulator transcription factor [Anaerolineae bacterium]